MSYEVYEVRVYPDGANEWHQNGKLHREDGPAIESANGGKHWYQNGKIHRENGPALEFASGYKAWYLEGERLTFEELFDQASAKFKEELFYNLDRS